MITVLVILFVLMVLGMPIGFVLGIAGIAGAATADAAAFGKTLVPAMVRQGYTRPFACAVTAAGSLIGPTIPPSSLMVIYGSIMGVSIGGLFAAGILPGLLICLVCMAMIADLARGRRPAVSRRPVSYFPAKS